MKRIFLITALIFSWAVVVIAQNDSLYQFQGKYHMLSLDEFTLKESYSKNRAFTSTPPPEGHVRSIAEFEPNQGVIVARSSSWSFGIPVNLIKMLSQDVLVYVIVGSSSWNSSVTSELQSAGTNMSNVVILNYPLDSYWTRDFSPWFITYGETPTIGIVDFPYNRPRPNDDDIPIKLAQYFGLELFGMNIEHTGGNYMSDGLGIAASTKLVISENTSLNLSQIQTLSQQYLGIENYMLIDDPLGDYIQHIDCWGKFLAVDKVLIGKVPANNSQYDEYEAVADYFAHTNSSYGNKYKVYRTYSPNGQPFTNCLIMNNKVYVPISSGDQANAAALNVFEEAMPGYQVIGVPYTGWQTTDALHCRTHEVPDFGMLYIGHIPYRDTIEIMDSYYFSAEIIPYSGQNIISNSVKIHYKINGGEYQTENLNFISDYKWEVSLSNINAGDVVEYYISASDESGRNETHPFIGSADPHKFVVKSNSVDVVTNKTVSRYSIFPNPASNRISIITDLNQAANINYFIYDINGKLVKQSNINAVDKWMLTVVDISDLNDGIYFLKIQNGTESITERFIVY